MKFKIVSLILAVGVTLVATAAIRVERRDMKLASQALLEKQIIVNPILADVDRLAGATATSASAITTVTSFLAQPDVPRNITVTPGGTTTDVAAGNITVTGTNFYNEVITEDIAILANASTAVVGAKAFKTVTSVVFPIQDGAGATYTIGVGDVLGLKNCLDSAGDVAWAVFNNAYEGTRPTCVADADEVEKNTCDINGTLDGTKAVKLYFVQNFACIGAQ